MRVSTNNHHAGLTIQLCPLEKEVAGDLRLAARMAVHRLQLLIQTTLATQQATVRRRTLTLCHQSAEVAIQLPHQL